MAKFGALELAMYDFGGNLLLLVMTMDSLTPAVVGATAVARGFWFITGASDG